ncbi:MAG: YcaO-like family protein [Desulfobacteraceae bacterium]|nr:YcaO-like family protein [Desulfobacteraceae bacterium]
MTAKWKLKNAYKKYTADQDKTLAPEQTVAEAKRRFEMLNLEILEETVRIDNGRLDIPVYLSVCGADARALTKTGKQMGKGATPQQAEASAVMELVERFSFYSFAQNSENFAKGTRKETGAQAMDFADIAKSVHDTSEDLEAARLIFDSLEFKWAKGFNLTRNEPVLVPFEWFFAINEFNGTSAGNTLEEALCQGICEIVERHVSDLVCSSRMRVPGIDPDSADDAMVRQMLAKYRRNGILIYASDFSLDIGIPSVGVLAWDPETFPEKSEIVWTAGTAPDPQKAFSRALSETAQLAGDFNTGSSYVASGLPKLTSPEKAEFITRPEHMVSINELPDISDENILVETERCIEALCRTGLEVITMETTHPGLGIPALYTVVPGAGFRERARASSVAMFCARLIAEKHPTPRAIKELKKIDSILPGKYFVEFYLGKTHLESGLHGIASKYFHQALELNPHEQDIPSIYSYLGQAYKETGAYEKALKAAKSGLAYDNERTDLYNLAGFCQFKLKDHEAAIDSFARAVRLNPSSAIDYANLAVNYRETGDTETAAAFFRAALDLDPGLDFARENLEKLTGQSP